MKVLVTGHNGYIGTVLSPLLIEAGHEVQGIDTDYYQLCDFGNRLPEIPYLIKDIRDIDAKDLEGFDAVVHLAALSNDPLGNLNPSLTYEINYAASVKLATLAKKAGVKRFLFSSSCSTYGAAGGEILTEEASFNPVTPYGNSKVLVEQEVAKLADDTFSPTFLRNATAYGVSPRLRSDLVLNNLVAWAYTTGQIYIKSDGTPWRPIVHVEDIAHAFVTVLNAPKELIHNQAYNVGINAENYQIRELAEIVKEIVPSCHIEYAKDGGPDKRTYRVSFTKIEECFPEFNPKWDAYKGVMQLYEAYKQIGINVDEFEGPKYQRVSHIKQLQENNLLDQDLRWKK